MSRPVQISNSSFGCTSFGAFCFICNKPFGNSSFNKIALKNHYSTHDKEKNHSIGTIKNKAELSKIIQSKIIQLLPRSNEFIILNNQTVQSTCSNCGVYISRKDNLDRHIRKKPVCSNAHLEKITLVKTMCGRLVLPPINIPSIIITINDVKNFLKKYTNEDNIKVYMNEFNIWMKYSHSFETFQREFENIIHIIHDPIIDISEMHLIFVIQMYSYWIKYEARAEVTFLPANIRRKMLLFDQNTFTGNIHSTGCFQMRENTDNIIQEITKIVTFLWRHDSKQLIDNDTKHTIGLTYNKYLEHGECSLPWLTKELLEKQILQNIIRNVVIHTPQFIYMIHPLLKYSIVQPFKFTSDTNNITMLSLNSCGKQVANQLHCYRLIMCSFLFYSETQYYDNYLNEFTQSPLIHQISPLLSRLKSSDFNLANHRKKILTESKSIKLITDEIYSDLTEVNQI